MTTYDAANHYDDNILKIEKFRPNHVWTAVLNDADQGYPYIKRFTFEPSTKKQRFIGENVNSTLILLTDTTGARFEVTFGGDDAEREPMIVDATEFIGTKSFKAKGKRLTTFTIDKIEEIEPNEEVTEDEEVDISEPEESTDNETSNEPEISDDELRDEINGQQRIF
jgi:topoisomerase-4 subunit A